LLSALLLASLSLAGCSLFSSAVTLAAASLVPAVCYLKPLSSFAQINACNVGLLASASHHYGLTT